MILFPAIDIKDGNVVRLSKGLLKNVKIYNKNPIDQIKIFEDMGAEWIHIIDIDGSFEGVPINNKLIGEICEKTNLKIQIGGGIRDEETIKNYLKLGVKRVILGSIVVEDFEFVERMSRKYPISISIDSNNGFVSINGWSEKSNLTPYELAKKLKNLNIQSIICTDISRDGMLNGLNISMIKKISEISCIPTIASGGLRDISEIKILNNMNNIEGVIVGKSYYEGTINLKESFEFFNNN